MNESNNNRVESFELDHTKVKAPFVRLCSVYSGKNGDKLSKFDIRFTQPNKAEMDSDGMHSLEHLLATYLRESRPEFSDAIVDLSPMGCRTGFYLCIWGQWQASDIADEFAKALKLVCSSDSIPADNEVQCGNYRLHNLQKAKEYAAEVLKKGLSDRVFG